MVVDCCDSFLVTLRLDPVILDTMAVQFTKWVFECYECLSITLTEYMNKLRFLTKKSVNIGLK